MTGSWRLAAKGWRGVLVKTGCAAAWLTGMTAGTPAAEAPLPRAPATVTMPHVGETVSVRARCGRVKGLVGLRFGEAKSSAVALNVQCGNLPQLPHHYGLPAPAGTFTDAVLSVSLSGATRYEKKPISRAYFIRPDLHFYIGEDQKRAAAAWSNYPAASAHPFVVSLVGKKDGLEAWIDGRYFAGFDAPTCVSNLTIVATNGAEVLAVSRTNDAETARYLPLDIVAHPHHGSVAFPKVSCPPGHNLLEGIPLMVCGPGNGMDVGLSRWLGQAKDQGTYCAGYYKRSAWDGLPESIVVSVPRRFYNYAHVLCAVDPAEGLSPSMTVRIARYRQAWDGAGGSQADTTVVVDPVKPVGCTAKRIGSVRASAGANSEWPLYLVEIPLKTGELADYLAKQGWDWNEPTDYFYLEFLREVKTRASVNYGSFEVVPVGPQSGLHLFGVTLEKAPADILVESDQSGHVFYADAQPALKVRAVNPSESSVNLALSARLADFRGEAREDAQSLKLNAGTNVVAFGLRRLKPGWYAAEFTFTDRSKRPVWKQPLTLAILPPDTRRAGNESPFGTWWFHGIHYGEADADKVLPLVQKMGFRHVTPHDAEPKHGVTSSNYARYGITPSMIGTQHSKSEAAARKFFADWPGTRFAMIFHETRGFGESGSNGIAFPPEFFGKPAYKPQGKNLERFNELFVFATNQAAMFRRVAPDVKIMIGNGGPAFNMYWLAAGLPRRLWDCLGMEMAIQSFHPEGQPTGWNLQTLWLAKKMREIHKLEDLPIASCYEFDYRSTAPGALSLKRQADWYARDALLCLAYGLPSINIALIQDSNSSYYPDRWGATGVLFRDLTPKPSFVALATLTRELDGAEYRRRLDAGSHSLHCLEFKRGAEWVYALWSARGEYETALRFSGKSGRVQAVDSMGVTAEAKCRGGEARLLVSESPVYLKMAGPLSAVKAASPIHGGAPTAQAQVLEPMASAAAWKIGAEEPSFQNYCGYHPMEPGRFALADGTGACIRVTLASRTDLPDLVAEYAVLEPKNGPMAIPGKPDGIGVWVNGNAGWGRVVFEVTDAKGRRWSSNGWEESPGSWDMSDWEGDTTINFDGWRFISCGLPLHYPSGYYGPAFHNWRCQGDNSLTNQLAYPLQFSRLFVVMRQKLVHVTDMVAAKSSTLELRSLAATYGTADGSDR